MGRRQRRGVARSRITLTISGTSSSVPVASEITRSYASSLLSVRRRPLIPRNAIVAASASRAFPSTRVTGLLKDSVANASQIVAIDRALLTERVGRISAGQLGRILAGIDIVLGRTCRTCRPRAPADGGYRLHMVRC